jgi:hypothetical protein
MALVVGAMGTNRGVFELYRDGFRIGLGAIDIVNGHHHDELNAPAEFQEGDSILATYSNAAVLGDVHILTDALKQAPPSVSIDEINQTHNKQHIVIPSAVCVVNSNRVCYLAGSGGRVILPFVGAGCGIIGEWSTLRDVHALVDVTVGARIRLHVLFFDILEDVVEVPSAGWSPTDRGVFPYFYFAACGGATPLQLEAGVRFTGVIWHCPSSHRNEFHGEGVCEQCGHSPLTGSYEVHLQRKGRYGRFNLTTELATKILGARPGVYQELGGGGNQRIRNILAAAITSWKHILIQRDHPHLLGKFPMETRVIVGVQ